MQITAVLVPVLASAAGLQVRPWQWAGCVLALAGTVLIAFDGMAPEMSSSGTGAQLWQAHAGGVGAHCTLCS